MIERDDGGYQRTWVWPAAGPAKLLQITSPGQFERFASEVGEPARERTLPPPAEPDMETLLRVAATYNIELAAAPPTR
jgi:hypothetical protein